MADGDDEEESYNNDELGYADDDLGSSVVGAETPAPSETSQPLAGSLGGDEQTKAMDWEVCGVAGIGGAKYIGIGVSCWMFRSKTANCQAKFAFVGAGAGMGGDMGGGSGPDPIDVATGRDFSIWTSLQCDVLFSVKDLNWASGRITSLALAATYGYQFCYISAGSFPSLFHSQNASGWGTGVGAVGAVMLGVWKQLGSSGQYY